MPSASQIFDTIAPDYAADPDKATYLELAALQVSRCTFGTSYNLALALQAAHDITVSKSGSFSGGAGGGIVSKSEGDLSVSYRSPSGRGSADYLSLTPYGLRLMNLAKGKTLAMGVTGSDATLFCTGE